MAKGTCRAETTSDSVEYSRTSAESLDVEARQNYERDLRNWQDRNSFLRASDHVDQWAQNHDPAFRTAYREERMDGSLHR